MSGIALLASELPVGLLAAVVDRLHDRAGRLEVRFEWWHEPALLPVRWGGSLKLLPWGSKARRSPLPMGPALTLEQVEAGILAGIEEVVVPANFGLDRGTWYLIDEGIRGVVVPETPTGPCVYLLLDRATNYYRNMTGQSPTMPVLVNQVI